MSTVSEILKETILKRYVLGFAFNDNHVLLIKKNRPNWQKGAYNGLGGHIEGKEQPIEAMVREFEEECSIATTQQDWEQFAIMKGEDWICYCFRSRNVFDLSKAKQTTDEQPEIIHAYTLEKYNTISNIPALIGLAMDGYGPKLATFDYSVVVEKTECKL
jgi:8-oxo-dGTP diphosphatase